MDLLNEEVNLDLFRIEETEEKYNFILKDCYLESKDLQGFLLEQFKMFLEEDEFKEIGNEVISELEPLKKADEIIKLSEKKAYENFQHSEIYDVVRCGVWRECITIKYDIIVFFIQGKVFMECYRDFLRYIENLIKRNSQYEISGAVKALID